MLMIPFLSPDLMLAESFSLIPSALCSSFFNISLLTSYCASFVRESSGNWCDWDTICSTRGFVTLTDEAYSRLASRDEFFRPRPSKPTGSARIFLSSWLHFPSIIAGISIWDIALSNGSNRSWMSGKVLKSTSTDVSSQRCRLLNMLVVEIEQILLT